MLNFKQTLRRRRDRERSDGHPSGFTLIELLVSIALILVIMSLFATVFQLAGGSISKMRGIAENDQRTRTVQTVLKADLDKRTFRFVYPFAANESASLPESKFNLRRGYFYISENNPYNALDDVLQFTVMSTLTMRNADTTPYVGQASNLASPPTGSPVPYTPPPLLTPNFGYSNQPDADDGQVDPNNTGQSTVAEVVYFVRKGNLYRRQLLIREPLALIGGNVQPTDTSGQEIFNPTSSAAAKYPVSYSTAAIPTTFWADFDYSAAYDQTRGARFIGTDDLDNSSNGLNVIGKPENRFGFSPTMTSVGGYQRTGIPKEFLGNDLTAANAPYYSEDLATFIGRFTMQETSDTDFKYPQSVTVNSRIPTDPNLQLEFDATTKALKTVAAPVDDFGQGSRRGEDLLLTNVHAFDIQVWDEGVKQFINLGDSTISPAGLPVTDPAYVADYCYYNRQNSKYGPRVFTGANPEVPPRLVNAVFDTWHPKIDNDGNVGVMDPPPYRPLKVSPNNPTTPPFTIAAATPLPVTVQNANFRGVWQQNQSYSVGNIVFPTVPKQLAGFPYYYQCVFAGTSGATLADEPSWPVIDGVTVDDATVRWVAVDNSKPLKAIRIQVRYVDTTSQQMRQVTIVHSLVD